MADREHEAGIAGSSRKRPCRRSRRPKRPAKLVPGAIADLLSAPVMVRTGGLSRKMLAFEASLHSQVKRALSEGDIGAIERLIRLCERYGILEIPADLPLRSGLFIIPKSWREEEWRAMFKKYGPPPWPGPRSGMPGDPAKD
jgi:hypothetical protein